MILDILFDHYYLSMDAMELDVKLWPQCLAKVYFMDPQN